MIKEMLVERPRRTKSARVAPPSIGQGVHRMEAMNAIVADAQRRPHAYVEAFKVEGGGE